MSIFSQQLPRSSKGFTLIELLVVIAIIGVLASIILVSLQSARAKGRDAKRISDLKTIALALAEYHLDNSSYPSTVVSGGSGGTRLFYGNCTIDQPWGSGGLPNSGSGAWVPNLSPAYIPNLPNDPTPKTDQCYIYSSDGTNYMLLAHLSVEGYTQSNNPYPRLLFYPGSVCGGSNPYQNDFAVYSDGAQCW